MYISSRNLVAKDVTSSRSYKLMTTREKTNGYALRRAVFELKPCIDLRQVRRGRKIFQIPRIIPSAKRQLFGVRRLLSVLTRSPSLAIPVKGRESTQGKRSNLRGESIGYNAVPSPGRDIVDLESFTKTDTTSNVTHGVGDFCRYTKKQEQAPWSQSCPSIYNSRDQRANTRIALRKTNMLSSLSLSSALGNEVQACSRSRSRAIESKKRIYRVASANRGSIRMSWWL